MQNFRKIAVCQIWTDPEWKKSDPDPDQNYILIDILPKKTLQFILSHSYIMQYKRSANERNFCFQLINLNVVQNCDIFLLFTILFGISLFTIGVGSSLRFSNISWISLFRFNFLLKYDCKAIVWCEWQLIHGFKNYRFIQFFIFILKIFWIFINFHRNILGKLS